MLLNPCQVCSSSGIRPRISPISKINFHLITRRPGSFNPSNCALKEPVAAPSPSNPSYDTVWDAFVSKVQGEWEGVTVTFNGDGTAQPLPERFVPGAYRDWGVELFDWQSQSSTLASPGGRSLRNIFKRLMPTVGCEADAIAYVEEAEDVWQTDGGSSVKPVTASGGYLAAPAQLPDTTGGRVRVEACLAAPDGRSRVRATLTLMRHWESKRWHVALVDLSRETYDGPFNGGVELSGCAGGGKPFAKDLATTLEQLSGSWRTVSELKYSLDVSSGSFALLSPANESSPDSVSSLAGDGKILLPLGVWVGCVASKADVRLEVGMLRGDAERDVAVCRYVDSRLLEVVLAKEFR